MRPRPALLALAVITLGPGAACTPLPERDAGSIESARAAGYRALVPAEEITGSVPPAAITPRTAQELDARSRALRARAEALKRDGIDAETRARMEAGISE